MSSALARALVVSCWHFLVVAESSVRSSPKGVVVVGEALGEFRSTFGHCRRLLVNVAALVDLRRCVLRGGMRSETAHSQVKDGRPPLAFELPHRTTKVFADRASACPCAPLQKPSLFIWPLGVQVLRTLGSLARHRRSPHLAAARSITCVWPRRAVSRSASLRSRSAEMRYSSRLVYDLFGGMAGGMARSSGTVERGPRGRPQDIAQSRTRTQPF